MGGLTTSCGMCGPGGRTAVYRLTLTERRHVIASLSGGFDTFLWINSGATCPGTNVMGACNDDAVGLTSQIDATLAAGTYWVMASGCGNGAAGVFIDTPSSVPLRSSLSVKTWRVPALKAILLTQPKFPGEHTTTAGSALPMKYSISALR